MVGRVEPEYLAELLDAVRVLQFLVLPEPGADVDDPHAPRHRGHGHLVYRRSFPHYKPPSYIRPGVCDKLSTVLLAVVQVLVQAEQAALVDLPPAGAPAYHDSILRVLHLELPGLQHLKR